MSFVSRPWDSKLFPSSGFKYLNLVTCLVVLVTTPNILVLRTNYSLQDRPLRIGEAVSSGRVGLCHCQGLCWVYRGPDGGDGAGPTRRVPLEAHVGDLRHSQGTRDSHTWLVRKGCFLICSVALVNLYFHNSHSSPYVKATVPLLPITLLTQNLRGLRIHISCLTFGVNQTPRRKYINGFEESSKKKGGR